MTSRAHAIVLPLACLVLGGVIWFVFPLATGKDNPCDDDDYWTCMIAVSALAGLLSPRRPWLSGLALAVVPLTVFCAMLIAQATQYWWPGLGVFLAFAVLLAVVAQLVATLRRLAMVALGRSPTGEHLEGPPALPEDELTV